MTILISVCAFIIGAVIIYLLYIGWSDAQDKKWQVETTKYENPAKSPFKELEPKATIKNENDVTTKISQRDDDA